jgi:hypothetical protein
MPASMWSALRQAHEALAAGRPEDAHRALEPVLGDRHRRVLKMACEVVRGYAARANRALDQHNPEAAWRDLLAAEALNTGEKAVSDLRYALGRLSVVQARAMLEAGRPVDTLDQIARIRDRGVRHPDLERLETAAQDWVHAGELADRGEFLRALDDLDRIAPKLPCPATGLDRFRNEVAGRHARFRDAVARLMDAAAGKRWGEAVAFAAEVLAVAPDHREAKAVRGRAWAVAAPETADLVPLPVPELPSLSGLGRPSVTGAGGYETRGDSVRAANPGRTVARPGSCRRPAGRPCPSGSCSGWTGSAGTSCACRTGSRSARPRPTGRSTCPCSPTCRGRTPN